MIVIRRAKAYPILLIPTNLLNQDDGRHDTDRCEHPNIPGFDVGQPIWELGDGGLRKWVPELQVLEVTRDASAATSRL